MMMMRRIIIIMIMIGINVHWNSASVTSETEEKRALNFACKRCPLQRRRVKKCSLSTK